MILNQEQILQIYFLMKKNENLLNVSQYRIFRDIQNQLYKNYSIEEIEKFNEYIEVCDEK